MTKRVVIANLSNWSGEDFEITIKTGIEIRKYKLQPGEHCDVGWGGDAEVEVVDKQRQFPPIKPFHIGVTTDGKPESEGIGQTYPKMSIEWENPRGVGTQVRDEDDAA